jgi:hypothetical protein
MTPARKNPDRLLPLIAALRATAAGVASLPAQAARAARMPAALQEAERLRNDMGLKDARLDALL